MRHKPVAGEDDEPVLCDACSWDHDASRKATVPWSDCTWHVDNGLEKPPAPRGPDTFQLLGEPLLGPWCDQPGFRREAWLALPSLAELRARREAEAGTEGLEPPTAGFGDQGSTS